MSSIEVNNLWVRYGEIDAVKGIDLEVSAGKTVAVLGRNGAGKTSTIEAIEGYRAPSAGEIRVLGLDPVKDRKKLLPKIGVMLQVGGVYPRMSARQALKLFAGFYDDPHDPEKLIDQVQLSKAADRPYRFLSGGEKQRLALALALIGKPRVLLLDEPTAGVDAAGKALIRELISESARNDAIVLMTTHELTEAERICDEILVIDDGKVVAQGTSSELRERYGKSSVTFTTSTPINISELTERFGMPIELIDGSTYRIESSSSFNAIGALTTYLGEINVAILELNAGKSSLEEVFLDLTSNSPEAQT